MAPADESAYAHPVERELARLFDEHGVRWLYEPHTFVLERDAGRDRARGVHARLLLPDLDLYVECTVAHPRLTSRKRRKVRKVRERRGVRVEVLFRRDPDRLAERWSLDCLQHAVNRKGPEWSLGV